MKSTSIHSGLIVMLLWSASGIFVTRSFAQDILDYGVSKRANYVQTTSTAPTTLQNVQFHAVLDAGSGSIAGGNITVTGTPGFLGFAASSPNHTFAVTSSNFPDDATLTANYPDGSYNVNIFHPAPGGGTLTSATLSLSGTSASSYPTTIPGLSNTNWSGGALQIDATQNFTFTWNSFAADSGIVGQTIHFTIDPPSGSSVVDVALASSATQFVLGSNLLTPGTSYTAHLAFDNVFSTDTSTILGATGATLYTDRTNFSITAIPEPSAAPLALGFTASALVLWRRRRRG